LAQAKSCTVIMPSPGVKIHQHCACFYSGEELVEVKVGKDLDRAVLEELFIAFPFTVSLDVEAAVELASGLAGKRPGDALLD
jgi:hypothetical protein